VRLVRETGKPIAQVARDLGINEGTLGNWVNTDRRRRDGGDRQLSEDERAELVRLPRLKQGLRRVQAPHQRSPVRAHLGEPGGERVTHATILACRLLNGHAEAAPRH
jgi:transposase